MSEQQRKEALYYIGLIPLLSIKEIAQLVGVGEHVIARLVPHILKRIK